MKFLSFFFCSSRCKSPSFSFFVVDIKRRGEKWCMWVYLREGGEGGKKEWCRTWCGNSCFERRRSDALLIQRIFIFILFVWVDACGLTQIPLLLFFFQDILFYFLFTLWKKPLSIYIWFGSTGRLCWEFLFFAFGLMVDALLPFSSLSSSFAGDVIVLRHSKLHVYIWHFFLIGKQKMKAARESKPKCLRARGSCKSKA